MLIQVVCQIELYQAASGIILLQYKYTLILKSKVYLNHVWPPERTTRSVLLYAWRWSLPYFKFAETTFCYYNHTSYIIITYK